MANTENNDIINKPTHYNQGGMETIDEMLMIFGREAVIHFCICNAWKYRARSPYKNQQDADMRKANWYLEKAKKLKQEAHDERYKTLI